MNNSNGKGDILNVRKTNECGSLKETFPAKLDARRKDNTSTKEKSDEATNSTPIQLQRANGNGMDQIFSDPLENSATSSSARSQHGKLPLNPISYAFCLVFPVVFFVSFFGFGSLLGVSRFWLEILASFPNVTCHGLVT